METRDATQIHIYALVLNTFGSAESGRMVAFATSEEALKNWYESQKLEKPINEDGWHITFKEGPIRRNNPLYQWNHRSNHIFGHGWFDQWVNVGEIRQDVFRVDF